MIRFVDGVLHLKPESAEDLAALKLAHREIVGDLVYSCDTDSFYPRKSRVVITVDWGMWWRSKFKEVPRG